MHPFGRKQPAIEDIVNGKADASSFSPDKLKFRDGGGRIYDRGMLLVWV
jgi:hypothetical protein